MAQRKKCIYYGMRLVSGKLYVMGEWERADAMPVPLRNPGRYSKHWNWGEQAGVEAYDLAYAMILHTFRTYPGKEAVANMYAIPYAKDVLSHLPTDSTAITERGASVPLWKIHQDEVHAWVRRYEGRRIEEARLKELLLQQAGKE